jgi:hypothetical protein
MDRFFLEPCHETDRLDWMNVLSDLERIGGLSQATVLWCPELATELLAHVSHKDTVYRFGTPPVDLAVFSSPSGGFGTGDIVRWERQIAGGPVHIYRDRRSLVECVQVIPLRDLHFRPIWFARIRFRSTYFGEMLYPCLVETDRRRSILLDHHPMAMYAGLVGRGYREEGRFVNIPWAQVDPRRRYVLERGYERPPRGWKMRCRSNQWVLHAPTGEDPDRFQPDPVEG